MRLLVVDDDPIQLKLAHRQLQLAGYAVVPASDGKRALAVLRTEPPDVVVSDVVMSELDGFALCEAIRADPAIAHVPVLLVTNSSLDASDRMLAKRSGARDLIVRTPDLGDVIAAIEALRA